MKDVIYETHGTCAKAIRISVNDDDTIAGVTFIGGCMGNTQGIALLAKGMKVDDVINRLEGILCGNKGTSCPDQLSRALKEIKKEM